MQFESDETLKTRESTPADDDGLSFEVVSLDQAREALDEPPAGVPQLRRMSVADWASRRRALSEAERRLSRAATQWLLSLPRESRPVELLRRYPRIANRLSERWDDTPASLHLLDELVLDRRGGRIGFPRPVLLELQCLREQLQQRARRATR
jgi:hypothetical protein